MTRVAVAVVLAGFFLPALPAQPALQAAAPQPQAAVYPDLKSPDAGVRVRAVRELKDAATLAAAVPLAAAVTDPDDGVQIEAMAAELNIFLAEKVVSRRRVALVVEVRNKVAAEPAFSAGPSVLGPLEVPRELLTALSTAMSDPTPRVALEAIYTFGTLVGEAAGPVRSEALRAASPVLGMAVGAPRDETRLAAVRVVGRAFARRAGDLPIDESLGDAVVGALNDKDRDVRAAAMQALGAMRYERAIGALSDLYQYDSSGPIGAAALDAVARIAHRSSAPLLMAAMQSRDPVVRLVAVEGVARLGDSARLAGVVSAAAAETNDAVLLGGHFASAMLGAGPLDTIAEALLRPKLHDQALEYLVELAPGRTSSFSRLTQDPDARLRAEGADALGRAGDAKALPIVEPLIKDANPDVARAASRAARRLGKT